MRLAGLGSSSFDGCWAFGEHGAAIHTHHHSPAGRKIRTQHQNFQRLAGRIQIPATNRQESGRRNITFLVFLKSLK